MIKAATVVGIVQPLLTLPQVIEIYTNQNTAGVSLITWGGYMLFGTVWFAYGVYFKLTPIWIAQILWVLMQGMIVVGIFIYG